ncbi:MAG: GDYXXLXY domain-containing protein [Planctomycetota bacterium]|jgi:uncharacterized membrane-anchored protein|nr:GDYXXLXY domain-containing protein [Planctomycetota bacterium]
MPETADRKSAIGRTALLVALGFIVAQAAFFIGWIWLERSRSGIEIKVETASVDPRDIFRGQYLDLSYKFDSPSMYMSDGDAPNILPERGQTVYAALAEDWRFDVYRPVSYAPDPEVAKALASDRGEEKVVVIRGRVGARQNRFDFGVNRYFVPEGTKEPPVNADVNAILLVPMNMRPRLRGLEVDGKRWEPERFEVREE